LNNRKNYWIIAVLTCVFLVAGFGSEGSLEEKINRLRLKGMAQYDEENFDSAVKELRRAVELDPTHAFDHINLGLALMENNQLDEALVEFQEARRINPQYVHIDYNLGICYKRLGKYKEAAQWLAAAARKDSLEQAIWYNLGVSYKHLGKAEEAKKAFNRLLEINPHNISAHYNLMRIALEQNDKENYRREMAIFRKLKKMKPPSDLPSNLEICRYSYMIDLKDALPPPKPYTSFGRKVAVRFRDVTEKYGFSRKAYSVTRTGDSIAAFGGIAVRDVDGDRYPDVLLYGPVSDCIGLTGLYSNIEGTKLVKSKTGPAPAKLKGATACFFCDYDNDDNVDIVCLRRGSNRLFHNNGRNGFADLAGTSGISDGDWSVALVVRDFDNDGDLDFLVADRSDSSGSGTGSLKMFRNNGQGTFSEIAGQKQLKITDGKPLGAAALDFDEDNDSDLAIFGSTRTYLFANKLWAPFEERAEKSGLYQAASYGWPADCNNDGFLDILIRSVDGGSLYLLINDGTEHFRKESEWQGRGGGDVPVAAAWCDFDNDGFQDLLIGDSKGIRLIRNPGREDRKDISAEVGLEEGMPVVALATADLDQDSDADIIVLGLSGIRIYENDGGSANNTVRVELRGEMNNRDAIGTKVELKAGRFYQKRELDRPYACFGIGNVERVDIVRIWWPNNVIQNEHDIKADSTVKILEKPAMMGSCPYVFAFDGRTYRFCTDALDNSPIGFPESPGNWFPPDGDEYVTIPDGFLREDEGKVKLCLTEDLREIAYIDQVILYTVDLPEGTRLLTNETFHSNPPSFELYAFPESLIIAPVLDKYGRDVTEKIRAKDGIAYSDIKNTGYLGFTEPYYLTIELGDIALPDRLYLVVSGWVEWESSSSTVAVWQNPNIKGIPPYLQAKNKDGEWVTIMPEMGYPPGWYKTTVIDLNGKLPTGCSALRIVSSMAIFWDEVALAGSPSVPAELGPGVKPVYANLEWRGYSREVTGRKGPRPVDFLWENPEQSSSWFIQEGYYTKYGRVDELVENRDGKYVVMNHGEALKLEFEVKKAAPAGLKRRYLLYVAGWCKDGDPNTLFATTVGPLPDTEGNIPNYSEVKVTDKPMSGAGLVRFAKMPSIWECAVP